ncbi:MAG: transcriptional regulator [Deltaproteobacteria bacterium]|nr:transcriptional regulator [Deltaproteobacteria bacterium]
MPAKPSSPFGQYLRTQRKAARLSQAELAKAIGVVPSYISQVETGAVAPLPTEHWPALVKALPALTFAELERTAAISRPLEIDLAKASPAATGLALALSQRIRDKSLGEPEAQTLLDLLQSAGAPRVRAHGRVVDAAGNPLAGGRAFAYRVGPARGWSALMGVRAFAGAAVGPFDARAAVLVGTSFDLLGPKDPRGAGFFDVPGGLPPGDYALDVHHTAADGSPAESWAWPLTVRTGGAAAQNVPLVCAASAPAKAAPAEGADGGGTGGGSGSGTGPRPPIDVSSLPPAPPLAKHFTKGTFTAAFSYYGLGGAPLDRIRRDLDRIRAAGFAHLRVWVDWERPSAASRIVDRKGALIGPQADKLDLALEHAAALGLSLDLTFETSHYDAVKKSAEGYDITNHKNAVRAVLVRWGQHPALKIVDLDNEAEVRGAGGHGSPDTGHTSPARYADLMGVARSVPRTCLVGASVSFSIDGMPKDYLNLLRDAKAEVLLPHFPRVSGWGANEGPNAKALAKALPGIPIHHQEPGRNGHSTTPPGGWPVAEFENAFRSSKAAGSLGCCFHTGAAFDLTTKDAWGQLDKTEREVVAHVAEWVK